MPTNVLFSIGQDPCNLSHRKHRAVLEAEPGLQKVILRVTAKEHRARSTEHGAREH